MSAGNLKKALESYNDFVSLLDVPEINIHSDVLKILVTMKVFRPSLTKIMWINGLRD